ncbi:hypothetical protein CDL12_19909 [Handroanthus impetiginosus]|uniref:Uncharacterized protein n=1 Tax=Handroanthus impetiginosus TaxID=429701 RepID=A0A2G9GQI3_9LAMI|nr:hypothetical protein CDL12_19909 [Handroanthus impetiginosus]
MNNYRYSDDKNWCYFHPTELVIGICALCLNEKLLVLASKQAPIHQTNTTFSIAPKKAHVALSKIFALTNLLNRLDIKQRKTDFYRHSSSTSPEDSFISIKFEENGVASWNKGKISEMPNDKQSQRSWNDSWDKAKKIKSLVEHAKPRAMLRWQRRIGHLFQFIGWKRSSKVCMCHVGTKFRRSKG